MKSLFLPFLFSCLSIATLNGSQSSESGKRYLSPDTQKTRERLDPSSRKEKAKKKGAYQDRNNARKRKNESRLNNW